MNRPLRCKKLPPRVRFNWTTAADLFFSTFAYCYCLFIWIKVEVSPLSNRSSIWHGTFVPRYKFCHLLNSNFVCDMKSLERRRMEMEETSVSVWHKCERNISIQCVVPAMRQPKAFTLNITFLHEQVMTSSTYLSLFWRVHSSTALDFAWSSTFRVDSVRYEWLGYIPSDSSLTSSKGTFKYGTCT